MISVPNCFCPFRGTKSELQSALQQALAPGQPKKPPTAPLEEAGAAPNAARLAWDKRRTDAFHVYEPSAPPTATTPTLKWAAFEVKYPQWAKGNRPPATASPPAAASAPSIPASLVVPLLASANDYLFWRAANS
jgi:hypothetical protein